MKYCTKYKTDPLSLIIEYSKINKRNINQNQLKLIAEKMKSKDNIYTAKYRFNQHVGKKQDRLP